MKHGTFLKSVSTVEHPSWKFMLREGRCFAWRDGCVNFEVGKYWENGMTKSLANLCDTCYAVEHPRFWWHNVTCTRYVFLRWFHIARSASCFYTTEHLFIRWLNLLFNVLRIGLVMQKLFPADTNMELCITAVFQVIFEWRM